MILYSSHSCFARHQIQGCHYFGSPKDQVAHMLDSQEMSNRQVVEAGPSEGPTSGVHSLELETSPFRGTLAEREREMELAWSGVAGSIPGARRCGGGRLR